MEKFDFSGWATKANLKCSDGRTILKDAFKHNDGQKVPLVWNHKHDNPNEILGHALLENREEGVYAYCKFNETESGRTAKLLVQHGDINALSIYANQLKEHMSTVLHGNIREVSLVLAGANPGASIVNVIKHGEEFDSEAEIFTGEGLCLNHSDSVDEGESNNEVEVEGEPLQHADENKDDNTTADNDKEDKTLKDVFDSMTEDQKTVVYALVGQTMEGVVEGDEDDDEDDDNNVTHSEGGEETMKKNLFENDQVQQGRTLTHADGADIVKLAKQSNVGSLKMAMEIFAEENELNHSDSEGGTLAHGIFENYEELFPEYELLKKGEPETIERDQSWIAAALAKTHKSPYSRIRTRHADARVAELKAKGYQKKGDEKTNMAKISMINRTTDPQTIYIKDDMHRDDVVDIVDFDPVAYQWKMMRHVMDETIMLAALVGDGREQDDPDKIKEEHVRSIWNDNEMYTIRATVDLDAAKKTIQGSNTGANFSDNYIYAEAIIEKALYAREQYKGSGTPDLYCTPHMVNVMLLARDMNGRRIYDSVADLAKALNVGAIHTVEQFGGRTRTDKDGKEFKLLGLIVNLADYQFGSTKGGQITRFDDFDIDFNKYKYMLETRLSGALTKLWSAIALEEPVDESAEG